MAKKQLQSGLILSGIAPNLLLKDVANTAPFLFSGELETTSPNQAYLAKLIFYKKNLNLLKNIDLAEYFHICMSAHWATAGTFVPTDVDNQIREGLWRHGEIGRYIEKMTRITIDAWSWDYTQVTNRKSFNIATNQVLSTHEGTWLSVAIGAYCALIKNKRTTLANEVAEVILAEIEKEQCLLLQLQENRDHKNYLRTCALMAHNFGDLDRVIDQWQLSEDDLFRQRIYKLGHKPNSNYSPILYFSGLINTEFLSVENHRHMSLRQPKCLRKSYHFLVPAGPFMDDWGKVLGSSTILSMTEKAEIIAAFFDGYQRQSMAMGYIRAFKGLIESVTGGMEAIEEYLPFNLVSDIKNSPFYKLSQISQEEFEKNLSTKLQNFKSDLIHFKF